ncbi:EamA family transporter RarD [Erythrobacter sp. W53]|uniref:EamA family transporter RarD n=1 Tax=Erythrobacter sp. W53 TaxID=3425947 RepID=UPI003D767953
MKNSDQLPGAPIEPRLQGKTELEQASGLPQALGAYLIWGLLPLYLLLVSTVHPMEFVAWRIVWTVPICLVIIAAREQWPELKVALSSRKTLGWLFVSASLIGFNWIVYVWAIQTDRVYAASLGYYINPLLNVLLGTVFLKETLTRNQWIAVGLAAFGVALLAAGAITTLWVSLSLAFSFALYGLVRKQVAVGAVPGLTIEAMLLIVPSIIIAAYFAATQGSAFFVSPQLSIAIVAGGVLTAVPLLLFAVAARRMDYSKLGFIQFLAPSIVFILGLTVFKEPLQPVQLACFACIWSAAALFAWDLLKRSRKSAN